MRMARPKSLVHTDDARPYSTPLAQATAWSSSVNRWTVMTGPKRKGDLDGPEQFHVVLLDNGRTAAMSNEIGREALKCIRCSACLNVCPVYERAGGHSYGSTYPGPIGAILSPQLTGIESSDDPNGSLPYASSLCGRCNEVCPVKIPITDILLELRYQKAKNEPNQVERAAFASLAQVWGHSGVWDKLVRMVALGRVLGGFNGKIEAMPYPISGWTEYRDVAVPPKKTFRQWWGSEEAERLLAEARAEGVPQGQDVNTKRFEEEKK